MSDDSANGRKEQMMQTLKLIFGQLRGIYGTIQVSFEDMLIFLQYPFKDWLKKTLWEKHDIVDMRGDFDEEVYGIMAVLDEDDDLHPSEFSWQGLRVDFEQSDASAEIVFAKDRIVGEIHLNYHKINGGLFDKVVVARNLLNDIQTPFKETRRMERVTK